MNVQITKTASQGDKVFSAATKVSLTYIVGHAYIFHNLNYVYILVYKQFSKGCPTGDDGVLMKMGRFKDPQ
jgi:hypothetical protein